MTTQYWHKYENSCFGRRFFFSSLFFIILLCSKRCCRYGLFFRCCSSSSSSFFTVFGVLGHLLEHTVAMRKQRTTHLIVYIRAVAAYFQRTKQIPQIIMIFINWNNRTEAQRMCAYILWNHRDSVAAVCSWEKYFILWHKDQIDRNKKSSWFPFHFQ